MVRVHGTNVLVDEFSIGRRNPYQRFIYFLTHCHTDHMTGLNASWDFGRIYCSAITKEILLNKFPNIKDVVALELNTSHTVYLNESKSLYVTVTLLDANHCLGSVMVLFQGYMGTILHTGDFRYTPLMLENSPVLFPGYLKNKDNCKCSIPIDELILDNTYCDPVFQFPSRKEAFEVMVKIIEENNNRDRILIAIDNLGKEEMLIELANLFQTLIVVNETRYSTLRAIGLYLDKFTTNPDEGSIEVIRKKQIEEKLLKYPNSICITATGWVNAPVVRSREGRSYIVAYSLHCNFREMETFVRCVQPAKITPLERVRNTVNKLEDLADQGVFALRKLKQRGLDKLIESYTDVKTLSKEYTLLREQSNWERIMSELGFETNDSKQTNGLRTADSTDTKMHQRQYKHVFDNQSKLAGAGVKFHTIDLNPNLNRLEKLLAKKSSEHMEEEKCSSPDLHSHQRNSEERKRPTKSPDAFSNNYIRQSSTRSSVLHDIDDTQPSKSQDDYWQRPLYELSQEALSQGDKPFFVVPSTLSAFSQAMERRKDLHTATKSEALCNTKATVLNEEHSYSLTKRPVGEQSSEQDKFRMMAKVELMLQERNVMHVENETKTTTQHTNESKQRKADIKPTRRVISSGKIKVHDTSAVPKQTVNQQLDSIEETKRKSKDVINSKSAEKSKTTVSSHKSRPQGVSNREQRTIDAYFAKQKTITISSLQNNVRQKPRTKTDLLGNLSYRESLEEEAHLRYKQNNSEWLPVKEDPQRKVNNRQSFEHCNSTSSLLAGDPREFGRLMQMMQNGA